MKKYRFKTKQELIDEFGISRVNIHSKRFKIINIIDNLNDSIDSITVKKVKNGERVFIRYNGNDYLIINDVILFTDIHRNIKPNFTL